MIIKSFVPDGRALLARAASMVTKRGATTFPVVDVAPAPLQVVFMVPLFYLFNYTCEMISLGTLCRLRVISCQ